MKISIYYKRSNVKEHLLCKNLQYLLEKNNIECCFSNEDDVDGILVLDKSLLSKAVKIAKPTSASVIYFMFRSEITMNYGINPMHFSYVFIVNDLDIQYFFPYINLSENIFVPFSSGQITKEYSNGSADNKIFVGIEEFTLDGIVLCKIIPLLNTFRNFRINILTKKSNLKNCVNDNITISDKFNLESEIASSKFIIGSGFSILMAIKYNKPCIIVGDKGYGGILNKKNYILHYHNFFQGRIGGVYDEQIPDYMITEDILNLTGNNYIQDLDWGKIDPYNDVLINKIKTIITQNKECCSDFYNTSLILNPDFSIIKGANDNELWAINRITKQIIGSFDIGYYGILNKFSDAATINNVMDSITLKRNKNISLSFIRELFLNKILICFTSDVSIL